MTALSLCCIRCILCPFFSEKAVITGELGISSSGLLLSWESKNTTKTANQCHCAFRRDFLYDLLMNRVSNPTNLSSCFMMDIMIRFNNSCFTSLDHPRLELTDQTPPFLIEISFKEKSTGNTGHDARLTQYI